MVKRIGQPGETHDRTSASNGDAIDTGLAVVESFIGIPTTPGASVTKTSVSGGKVTIGLLSHAGAAITANEDIDWQAKGRD